MTSELNPLCGAIGNCPEGLTYDYVKSELIDKANEGDVSSVLKLIHIARFSNQLEIKAYAKQALALLDAVVLASALTISGTAAVVVGATTALTATFTPETATFDDVIWTTSDATKATVAAGVVTGVGAGEVTITATSAYDTAIVDTQLVTVSAE